jgi:sterol desaturase/sphingolipid hydroxylase (fatty acid hydroxylase superfamily)
MGWFGTESLVRFGLFAGVLALMALWEILAPRRPLRLHRPLRWLANLGMVVLATLAVRLLIPLGVAGMALLARERGWGLFNHLALPAWLAVLLSVIALDLLIYLQHVLFHAVPVLWRVHRVHHADLDFDTTTGVRFHPLEILLSTGIKMAGVLFLGAPALGVLLFEVLLNATSLFNHGNVRLPARLDRLLRAVVVTPEMHRVHHSAIPAETNSNFGFNLPWWDYLLGTYRDQPALGHEGMTIGLSEFPDERRADRLHWMLLLPFLPVGNTPAAGNARGRDRTAEEIEEPATHAPGSGVATTAWTGKPQIDSSSRERTA